MARPQRTDRCRREPALAFIAFACWLHNCPPPSPLGAWEIWTRSITWESLIGNVAQWFRVSGEPRQPWDAVDRKPDFLFDNPLLPGQRADIDDIQALAAADLLAEVFEWEGWFDDVADDGV